MGKKTVIKNLSKAFKIRLFGKELRVNIGLGLRRFTNKEERNTKIAFSFLDGVSVEKIAEKFSLTTAHVFKILWIKGVRRKEVNKHKLKRLPHDTTQVIKELREKGDTLQAIGDRFGITREGIRLILNREK